MRIEVQMLPGGVSFCVAGAMDSAFSPSRSPRRSIPGPHRVLRGHFGTVRGRFRTLPSLLGLHGLAKPSFSLRMRSLFFIFRFCEVFFPKYIFLRLFVIWLPMLREKPIWGVPPCTPTVLVGAGAPKMGFSLSMRSLFYIFRGWEDFLRKN